MESISTSSITISREPNKSRPVATLKRPFFLIGRPSYFTTALVVWRNYFVPSSVILCCHLAMAGGTMAGGWRIIKNEHLLGLDHE